MTDEELEKLFASISRIARHLMLQIMKGQAQHLALITHLRYSGLLDSAKLEAALSEVNEHMRPIFESLENVEDPEVDRLLEMLLKFEGPLQ